MTEPTSYLYVTLSGIPLQIDIQWPFQPAKAGGDFHVVHGTARLLLPGKEELHAKLAVHLAATVIEELSSTAREHTEVAVVNAIRKAVDTKDLEFLKSDKLQPVPISSRHYDFKRKEFRFVTAGDAEIRKLALRRVYWAGAAGSSVAVSPQDPIEAQYVGITPARLCEIEGQLASDGFISLQGETVSPTAKLQTLKGEIESAAEEGLQELQEKHAFEARHMSH